MPRDKSAIDEEGKRETSIVEGWTTVITKEYRVGELNDREKAQFDRARFSDEQASRNSFVLGGEINRRF